MFESLLHDVRYGVRGLRRSPGFAIVAVLTLALGIGANTAIFSVIDAVLLRPLPYAQPGRLVRLYETEAAPGHYPFVGLDYLDWKRDNHSFQDMALLGYLHNMNLSGEGQPEHVRGTPTEANYFSLLGARPLLGRTWVPGEDEPGHDREVILSFGLWQSHFGGDPKIVGRDIELDGQKYSVIGVMPAGFHPSNTQLWVPQDMDTKTLSPRGSHSYSVIGRLKPNVTLQQAQSEMSLIASRLEQQYPDTNHEVGAFLLPLQEDAVAESKKSLWMMLWAVALVLLIACANVANLLLSRAVARQKEMAVRGALGAARIRLIRQMLTESVLLSSAGAILGLLFAWIGVRIIVSFKNLGLPGHNVIGINVSVLLFTVLLAVSTGILFGLIPALQISRSDLYLALKSGTGAPSGSGSSRIKSSDFLVIAEMALSLLLLISASLLLKDFLRLRAGNIGVRSEGVWTAAISLPKAKYSTDAQVFSFGQNLLERVQHIAGVESASLSDRLPLEGGNNGYVAIRGEPFQPMSGPLVENHAVTPDYFRAVGIPLLRGRGFNDQDVATAFDLDEKVTAIYEKTNKPDASLTDGIIYPVIINHSMAEHFWKGQNPIGKMFSYGNGNGPWKQVVGVVGDVKQWGLTHPPQPEAYDAFDGSRGFYVVVHSSNPQLDVTSGVRNAVSQLDSTLPLYEVRSMEQVIAENASGQQFLAMLLGLFSALALVLAAVGIYGVVAYLVTQRTREIGIRMSLGADRKHVLALVLKYGMRLALIGFAVGLVAAVAAGRLLTGMLHEIHPADPGVLIITVCALLAVALAACYLPARRAATVDPMVALRSE